MQTTAVLTQAKDGGYVAYNPETGTKSQGDNLDGGLASLREAVELYPQELRDEA
jgi:predicted RNase H-like HicB family nuclease